MYEHVNPGDTARHTHTLQLNKMVHFICAANVGEKRPIVRGEKDDGDSDSALEHINAMYVMNVHYRVVSIIASTSIASTDSQSPYSI